MTSNQKPRFGARIVGVVKSVKGHCNAGHFAGQSIDLSAHDTGGMCGLFYHQLFPYILMLQFGGGFPQDWGDPDVIEMDCMDKHNLVTIELRRL